MEEYGLLDSGPLGHAFQRHGMALADQCRLWIDGLNVPTASAHALDADVILAACSAMLGQPGDQVIVATVNVGHLVRYCDARLWTTIA